MSSRLPDDRMLKARRRRPDAVASLQRGDLLPRIVSPPPGPRARQLAEQLATFEAPGVNTVGSGPSPLWREARGANVLDVDGNRYVDLTSGFGVALVGHRHPAVVAAVRRQAARLLHGFGDVHAHPARVALAAALVARAPMEDAAVYFAASGSDAVEVALKTAVLASGRPGVLAFAGGYHGLTLGALAAGGREAFRFPFAAHLHTHVEHLPFGAPASALAARLARGTIGSVIVEPVQGRAGVVLPPPGWLAELASLARRHGALLIVDEILTGGGRTGSFFASTAENVEPDLLCCGKALAGGLPFAAVLGRRELLDHWPADGEALHTATFLAHPLACSAALATLRVLDHPDFQARAVELAAAFATSLEELAALPIVRAVRGRGLLWGIELRDDAVRSGGATAWSRRALGAGVLTLPAGERGEVLELLPPAVLTQRQLAVAIAGLRRTAPAQR
ncbi:MAG TPA: aspartate aminotransferase family protein [Thermoanaerobaculia bacterium]|jgi:acetylornithine/succinyldiaminopimelate/putrescine aminotransferase|nr:aspartate aminotransferase family protein [Thermoanaerobaculia bacterium]